MFTLYSREVDKGRGGSGRAEQAVVAGARRGIRLYWNIECGFITVSVFSRVTPKRVDHLPDRAANLGELALIHKSSLARFTHSAAATTFAMPSINTGESQLSQHTGCSYLPPSAATRYTPSLECTTWLGLSPRISSDILIARLPQPASLDLHPDVAVLLSLPQTCAFLFVCAHLCRFPCAASKALENIFPTR